MRIALTMFAAAVVLGGCQDQAAPAGPERRSAAGGVLGGAVNDEMLPLDTVRSTAPPATDTADAGSDTEDDAGESKAGSRRATPAPSTPAEGGRPEDASPSLSATPAATQADD